MKFTKIRTQMMSYFILLLAASLLISSVLYQKINRNLAESKIADVSDQTLYAIRSSLQSLFDNTNKYSQRIIANSTIQEILQTDWKDEGIVESNQIVQRVLYEILLAEPTISSVYLIRNDDLYYSVDDLKLGLTVESVRKAPWYREVLEKNGSYIWRIDAGGILNAGQSGERYLSLIRSVNDLNTAKRIGILILNVPMSQIKKSYERSLGDNKMDLMVMRENELLIPFSRPELRQFADSESFRKQSSGTTLQKAAKERYLVAASETDGWKYATALNLSEWSNPYGPINRVLIPIVLFNFVFIFLGSIWISRSITYPILSLLKSMRKAESGEFQQVRLTSRSGEIRQLQDRYNSMITTIEEAILREKEEQRTRRKLELDILQQQIKPHFLYNALESAGYLTLTGERHEAYGLITALAQYYRLSLSKGSEVIPLEKEFEIAKNYLFIQNMRYPGLFESVFELDECALGVPVPKLTLQPLVENALYHGIRPMGQAGTIKVAAKAADRCITLTVEDDGVGIDADRLATIQDGQLTRNASSFGLRGTIKRLQLYYGEGMTYSLTGEPGRGTVITIVIPQTEDATWKNEPSRPSSSTMS